MKTKALSTVGDWCPTRPSLILSFQPSRGNEIEPAGPALGRGEKCCTGLGTSYLALLLLCACGGSAVKEPETSHSAPAEQPREARPSKGGPSVSQELGVIDPKEADQVFERVQSKFQTCQKTGMKRVGPLAGDVKFFVRIGPDGHAKYVVLEDSTMGDVETERCMVEAVNNAQWPIPRGGQEAEARKGYSFDAGDEREPARWGPEKVQAAVAKHDSDLKKCTAGVTGTFKITVYVEPEKKDGKVLSVGVAPPSNEAVSKVDCIVDAVKAMKLPSPGGYLAKATFSL
jgi:hypothetical protein